MDYARSCIFITPACKRRSGDPGGLVTGKSSESVKCAMCAMLKACDACADMGQLQRTVPIRKTFCCGELLINFHGYNKMHDAIT